MNLFEFLTPKSETMYLDVNSTIRQALEKMDYHSYTVIPVLDSDGKFAFSLSDGDILRYIKNVCNFNLEKAENIKITEIKRTREYVAININASLDEILKLSLSQNFIPLVDDREVFIGILRRKSIIEYSLKDKM